MIRPLLVVVTALLFVAPGLCQEPVDETPERRYKSGPLVSVFADPVTIPAGTVLEGPAVCIGCEITLEGELEDQLVVVFGKVRVSGQVEGDVVGVLSGLDLRDGRVDRQVFNILGSVDVDGADVQGVVDLGLGDWMTDLPSPLHVVGFVLRWSRLVTLFAVFLLIGLIAALVPERVRVIGELAPQRYGTAFFVGLLGYLGILVILTLLSFTIIAVPLGIALFRVVKWLGASAVFWAVGRRLGRSFGRDLSVIAAVFVGFVPYVLIMLVPLWFGLPGMLFSILAGLFSWVFLEVPALGLALMTRFGTRGPTPTEMPIVPAEPAPQ